PRFREDRCVSPSSAIKSESFDRAAAQHSVLDSHQPSPPRKADMAFSLAPLLKGSAVCSAKSTQLGYWDNVERFASAQHRERGFSCAKDFVDLRPSKWT